MLGGLLTQFLPPAGYLNITTVFLECICLSGTERCRRLIPALQAKLLAYDVYVARQTVCLPWNRDILHLTLRIVDLDLFELL
jgi:hypothetical protein